MGNDTVFQIRLSKDQKAKYEAAAHKLGVKLAEWIRHQCDSALEAEQALPVKAVSCVAEEKKGKPVYVVNRLKGQWNPK